MKKLLIITITALIFVLAVTGCTDKEEKKIDNITRTEEKNTPIKQEEVTEVKENEPEEEPSKEITEEENSDKAEEKPTATLSAILGEIKTAVNADGAMDLDASAISTLYGIASSDIKEAAGFVVMAGTFPHEVVMVETTDDAAAQRAEELLKAKHSAFVEQSKGYDAENYALAQKCKVDRKGNRITMFLSPDYAVMNSIYGKYN